MKNALAARRAPERGRKAGPGDRIGTGKKRGKNTHELVYAAKQVDTPNITAKKLARGKEGWQ